MGNVLNTLLHAWDVLGQVPLAHRPESTERFWMYALKSWDKQRLPRSHSVPFATG
jgi:hypothetical protein